jgi:hypothetical protein
VEVCVAVQVEEETEGIEVDEVVVVHHKEVLLVLAIGNVQIHHVATIISHGEMLAISVKRPKDPVAIEVCCFD